MKKTVSTLLGIAIILFSSCGNSNQSELVKITHERDSLIKLAAEKIVAIKTFAKTLTEIENSLINIKQKENVLSIHTKKNKEEIKGPVKDEINNNVQEINDLMPKNAEKFK